MEPESGHESRPEAEDKPTGARASSSHGMVGHVAKLMGKTAGLAQNTGAKTADSMLAAGRQAGKLLHVPSKLWSILACRTEKKREAEFDFEIERLGRRIEKLYARIGERVCHSPLIDRYALSADPHLEALVSTVRDLEAEVTDLEQRDQSSPVISHPPKHQEPTSAAKPTVLRAEESKASEPAPSPAPEEGQAPPTGA